MNKTLLEINKFNEDVITTSGKVLIYFNSILDNSGGIPTRNIKSVWMNNDLSQNELDIINAFFGLDRNDSNIPPIGQYYHMDENGQVSLCNGPEDHADFTKVN